MPTKKESPNIHQRLVAVRSEIAGIGKDARNKFQNFEYVSHSKVLGKIRTLMDKHGVALTSAITGKAYEVYTDKKGARQLLVELTILYTFVNVDDPKDAIQCEWYSQGTDAGERCVGKALSYSNKYFLLSQFLVPTDRDDPDASDLSNEPAQPADPMKAQMTTKQRNMLQSTAKKLFGDEYKQATKDICDNVGAQFPPKSVEDFALLKAEFQTINAQHEMKASELADAAKETFNGKA